MFRDKYAVFDMPWDSYILHNWALPVEIWKIISVKAFGETFQILFYTSLVAGFKSFILAVKSKASGRRQDKNNN
jgi:hypothetical protein